MRTYRLVSLSGGGYRAALFHAGVLRVFHSAGLFEQDSDHPVIVNAVSGGSLPTVLWNEYLHVAESEDPENAWPEEAVLDLVNRTPTFGGRFNWQIRGRWS